MDFLKMSDITKNNRAAVFSWWHSFIGHYFSMEKHFFLKIASRCLFFFKKMENDIFMIEKGAIEKGCG